MKYTMLKIGSVFVALAASTAFAQTHNFGGWEERFKGEGDMEPPQCQIEVPRNTTSAFFVKWNCTDNEAPADQIRTELWMLRNGAQAPVKISEFLGFPASVQIDEGLLESETIEAGLPAAFRLVARDRAGVGVITPYLQVSAQSSAANVCDLEINRESTESTGGTTGTPESSVVVEEASVVIEQPQPSNVNISSNSSQNADPCEIDDICANNAKVTFQAAAELDDVDDHSSTQSGTFAASGSISISPGSVESSLEGTARLSNGELSSLSLQGETQIDGADALIELRCSKRTTVSTATPITAVSKD